MKVGFGKKHKGFFVIKNGRGKKGEVEFSSVEPYP